MPTIEVNEDDDNNTETENRDSNPKMTYFGIKSNNNNQILKIL